MRTQQPPPRSCRTQSLAPSPFGSKPAPRKRYPSCGEVDGLHPPHPKTAERSWGLKMPWLRYTYVPLQLEIESAEVLSKLECWPTHFEGHRWDRLLLIRRFSEGWLSR